MSRLDAVLDVINAHASELKAPGVISIRPGYKVENGWPTTQPAIVVVVSRRAGPVDLPPLVEGIPVDVRRAGDVEQLRFDDPQRYNAIAQHRSEFRGGAFQEVDPVAEGEEAATEDRAEEIERGAPAKASIEYTPADVPLEPITGTFSIVCHASPDAGWPTLRKFISGVESTLTMGLYDFTSEHILDELKNDLGANQTFELVLDHPTKNPTADQTDPETVAAIQGSLGDRFEPVWALVKSNKEVGRFIFPSAYHIKTAVSDSKVVWLSSGNWNNSNQPDIDPFGNPQDTDQQTARKSDRDWHVIINNADIARQFEAYIKHDFNVAQPEQMVERGEAEEEAAVPEEFRCAATGTFKFFEPKEIDDEELTITPLLTPDPDSYRPAMLNLINSTKHKLYIQLQYIHPPKHGVDEDFKALIDAVVAKINAGKDVRIICSQFQAQQGWLERLQEAGVDLRSVKIQNGVHNKGFVVDGEVVALGSQNWSGDGVLRNRDASVIIKNKIAAKYYQDIFLHDWERIAKQRMDQ
jgi:phosphatidylserine/phosphatidylglycerophosphate/cardiolipin synthase-like enzyme